MLAFFPTELNLGRKYANLAHRRNLLWHNDFYFLTLKNVAKIRMKVPLLASKSVTFAMQNDNFGLLKGQLSQHQSGTFTFLRFKNGFSIVKKALFSSYFSIFSLSRFFTSKYAISRLFLYKYSRERWEFRRWRKHVEWRKIGKRYLHFEINFTYSE